MPRGFPEVLPLRRASQRVIRELGFLQSSYAPANLPFSHWHAILAIESGTRTQRELATQLQLDKSTTSRIVERLRREGWITSERDAADARATHLVLTTAGQQKAQRVHANASGRVQQALEQLRPEERAAVVRGMALYARALERARLREGYAIRRLKRSDNSAIARIIRSVMPEFGADGPGFAIHDLEVQEMSAAYAGTRAAYFVLVDPGGVVVGGGGLAPLSGGDDDTCELRKMYFLREARGLGFGQALLERCLAAARDLGFTRCYLETLERMHEARAMYEKNGFRQLRKPEGTSGHSGCDTWYAKSLENT